MDDLRRPRTGRRWLAVGVAAVVASTSAAPAPAVGAPTGSPVAVVTATALDATITQAETCDGATTVVPSPALLKVARANATVGQLAVEVTYGGSLVSGTDYDPLPDPVVLAPGDDATFLEVRATTAGTVTLTIEPGQGYDVGTPASATATVHVRHFTSRCERVDQTVEVGTAPADLDVYGTYGGALADATLSVHGDLPPGLGVAADGTWTGTAIQVGTYRFRLDYCIGDLCALQLVVTITVVPEAATPAPPPPAPAVADTARYTG